MQIIRISSLDKVLIPTIFYAVRL